MRNMEKVLVIADPIPEKFSVQYTLIRSILEKMKESYDVFFTSTYLSEDKETELQESGINVIHASHCKFPFMSLLRLFGKDNESMLWLESWFDEALLRINGRRIRSIIRGRMFDHVINLSSTIPYKSDLWWNQGMPLEVILEQMSGSNNYAAFANKYGKWIISRLNKSLLNKMRRSTKKMIVNSNYMYNLYSERGLDVSGVVYSTYDLSTISSTTTSPKRDFVLVYLGKETDLSPIKLMAKEGIRIVSFGSKLPIGSKMSDLNESMENKGYVTKEELLDLYSNALFTAFPFTNEPFGYIPLESMACGTPVLTYNKQGPSETVVHKKTGWLADSADEFIKMATDMWQKKETEIRPDQCVQRVKDFSIDRTVSRLLSFLPRDD